MKAKVAIIKVKRIAAPLISIGEDKEARPFDAPKGIPTFSKICILGMTIYPRFFEDSIPLEVKEAALVRSAR